MSWGKRVCRASASCQADRAARGRPPSTMCQPVAMTGSQNLETQGIRTVPMAMLWAASSIHQAPLSHREPGC